MQLKLLIWRYEVHDFGMTCCVLRSLIMGRQDRLLLAAGYRLSDYLYWMESCTLYLFLFAKLMRHSTFWQSSQMDVHSWRADEKAGQAHYSCKQLRIFMENLFLIYLRHME